MWSRTSHVLRKDGADWGWMLLAHWLSLSAQAQLVWHEDCKPTTCSESVGCNSPGAGERRKVHRNEVVWCDKRLCSVWIGREQAKAALRSSLRAKVCAGYPFAICLLTSLSPSLGTLWKWTQITLSWRESATALQRASAHPSGVPTSPSRLGPATASTRTHRPAAMAVSDHWVWER